MTTVAIDSVVPPLEETANAPAATETQILALELHNNSRLIHDAPPLALDENLCHLAQLYAEAVASELDPVTPENSVLGHNIYKVETSANGYRVSSDTEIVREALTSWCNHSKRYNWRAPSASPKVARLFSQVVWKSTKKLGVGVANWKGLSRKAIVVVCLYSPAGNLKSDVAHRENVSRPQF